MSCKICKSNIGYEDGEAIPDGYGGYTGSSCWVQECKKGYTKKYEQDGLDCKGLEVITLKCQHCKQETAITDLKEGFCSENCKNTHLDMVKDQVINEEKRAKEIKSRLSKLSELDYLQHAEEISNLKLELNGCEHYLDEGRHILSAYGIAM